MDDSHPHPVIAWREALLTEGSDYPAHDLPSTARLVGVGLSMHATRNMKAWPSSTTLAARCGLGDRAVRRALADLEAAGWVFAAERGGVKGGHRTTVWLLLTPVAKTDITPARKTGVHGADPGLSGTTPVSESTTPVAKTDELEELDELEGVSARDLAVTLVHRAPEEARPTVEAAMTDHGERRVSDLVRAYAVSGTRFVFASDLRKRIDRDAGTVRPVGKQPCDECGGDGVVSEAFTNTARRCPKCNADPIGVSGGDGHRSGGVAS